MKIFAHRGASGEFPENTLLAFEQAIKQHADGIEFDVQYHQQSGEFILLHDSYLIVDNEKIHYNELSLAQLFAIQFPLQQRICTLTEALKCIGHHCQINIELKSSAQGVALKAEITALKNILNGILAQDITYDENLIISSFNHYALMLSSVMLPNIKTAALIAHCPIHYAKFCEDLSISFLNISADCLNQELVNDAHNRGLKVFVYTVDLATEIRHCLSLKVDGFFTNLPAKSRQIIST